MKLSRSAMPSARRFLALAAATCLLAPLLSAAPAQAAACDPPFANEIVAENCLPGAPPSEWDVSGPGDDTIQGFATDISVNQGETVQFKIDTPSNDYRLDIYRLGFYDGDGARKVATVQPTATLPQTQPACLGLGGTLPDNLVDCGNWAVSASWTVPSDATSGFYIARPTREDVGGDLASHIAFIVRDDDGGSDLLFQASDTTWQAYNRYGGYSLYDGPGHAHKVSYNRPFTTRGAPTEDWLFNAEYPMIRWLERNGYDVSYFTDTDSDRRGSEILEHSVFLSVGHDEYWSKAQRDNVEAARDAGVDLAFFSGNEIYWKTRWEPSTADGGSTEYRTLVSYKEGDAQGSEHYDCQGNFDCDPTNTWTGLWRQNQAGHDGGRPENSLSGQISWGDATTAIQVPASATALRFWRNTGMTGATTLTANTLGYEFDWEQPAYASSYPPGRITLSDTTATGKNHRMSLYRAPSGALVFGAGTVQWSWGLDATHDRESSTEDPRMQQATVNLLSDMGAQPATLQSNLVAGPAADTTAPTADITDPAGGATVPGGNVTVSGTAADTAPGVVAAVEVSTDGGATWTRATGTTNWNYTFSASNGTVTAQARAVDDAANIGTADSVTFDVAAQVCPCSIFGPSVTGTEENDNSATELGVKFRSDVEGFVTGIRFYKTAGNTGTHTGTLWSTAGANLGTITFSGESPTGWQEATFDSPIAIDAGITYVASYHTTVGRYATGTSFAGAGVDSPPLHALMGGVDGPNGVYRYGNGGVYPTDTFGSSNYLVDVVFVDQVGPDTTPPTIVQRSPAPNASGVAVGADVTATFSEPMAAGSITTSTVELRDPSDAVISAAVTYNAGTRTAVLDPSSALASSTPYTATVKGGPSGVTDVADPANPLAADVTWSFTTAAPPPPPPDEGPGGPILVVSSAANPFSRYYVEILRNEGLNAFNAVDITTVDATLLADYDVVILGEVAVDATQALMFETWVTGGGNLIAMRPDPDLAGLLGLTDAGTDLSDAYLQIDTSGGKPGTGLVNETIQFHGTADRYTLDAGAQALATLYSDASTATANPAVTLRDVGPNGGQAAAFTYDLARSVVYTRQGNPAWAGQERDGQSPPIIRADDMFYPDWIDFSRIQIPQADEQQRLLANLIEHVNRDVMPLPRFWYFPRGEKAVVVMTGDDHGSGGTAGQFDWAKSVSPDGCNVDDWECIRQTSYIYPNTGISDAAAAAYQAEGFEIAIHVNTNCADWTPSSLATFYSDQLASFGANFPSLSPSATHRTHCITWSDWATQPQVELDNGIRLDTNYYYWPEAWVQDRPGWFTGSGMPMRFADLDGSLIDVYQATTQMPDESGLTYATHINTLLDNAIGAPGYYGVVTTNMHTDSANHAGQQAVVNAALARGVPVVSARQMLTWLDGRNGSSFANLAWNAGTLTFSIARGAGSNGLQAMLPTQGPNGSLGTLTLDGSPVSTSTETIKGIRYAVFDATAGAYSATFAADTTAPAISSVVAVPGAGGTATVTWTTDEASTSRVDYGISAGSLTFNVTDPALVTSHTLELTGLDLDTTYYFQVSSTDAANNTATSPADPASFTTPTAVATDTTVADFSAGSTGGSTYVSDSAGGEVILAPSVGAEFSGTSLPGGWSTGSWNAGSSNVVGGGNLTVDGSWTRADGLVPSGRTIEFVGTFSGAAFQNAGFGVTLDASGESWAMFGTNATAGTLQARTRDAGGTIVDVALGAQYIGSPHRFRIEWDTAVRFYIDGALVHTAATLGGTMRPIASDFAAGGGALSIDWMRMTPYASPGTFLSRIHDAGGAAADWGALSYVADVPPGTTLALEVRTGETPAPGGSWSTFAPIASGENVATSGRYLQYRAGATSTTGDVTPSLESVTLPYTATPDTTAPTITGRTPAPGATGVAIGTDVTVTFDEPMDPATITSSTVTLRAQGAGADVPASVGYAGTTATLNPSADLDTSTQYTVTVSASVEDTSGNALGTPDTWTFTTSAPLSYLIDTTAADFGGGSTGPDTYVAETADGEVVLAPTVGAEFSGTSLPGGWTSTLWSGGPGGSTFAAGILTLDQALLGTDAFYAPGRSLEFVANFSDPNQHVGLANDFNSGQWAIFSSGASGDQLYARSLVPGGVDTPLGATYLDGLHRYRIEWTASQVRYLIDGVQVALHGGVAYTDNLRPAASDFNASGSLAIDWMRLSPYPASGTFTSRVLDAGSSVDWMTLSWTADTPGATSVAFEARAGDTPTPDGTWGGWNAVSSSGGNVGMSGRYLQYRAILTSADESLTPTVSAVTAAFQEAPIPPPAAPTNLVVTRQAGPQFTLTWTDHATNESGFAIERSTDGLPFLPLATAPASSGTGTTSFIDTTVENEHSYRYQVAAVNSVDQSAWATSAVVWTQANAPSDLAGTVGPTGTTVALSWIDHSSVEGSFALQRSTDPTFATVSQFTRPANSTTFTQQGLTLGTTYYYRIRVNWMGSSTDSAWSNVITVVTPSNVPPAAPTNLVVTRQAGPQFTLTWTDHATNETGFAIERSTDGLPFLPLATAPASSGTGTTSFIDTTVENEHSYRYQVAAVNSVDQSAWATSAVVWTQANAPSDLAGTVGPTGTTVALSWIDHSSVEGSFALQRSTDPTFATVSQFTRPANSTTFTQQGLTLGTTYYYRIRVNWMGSSTDSAWSNVITVVTPSNVPPAAPTNLVVTRQAGPQFTLTWTDHATNETGFAIERSTDGLPFLPLATAPASSGTGTTSFIDTTVENEHSYRYQVAAVNSVDQSAWATSAVVWTQANAPSDLAGTVGPTGTTVALSWIDHSSVEGSFALQRSTDPTFATVSQFTRPANSTTFTQQGLTLGTTYYYRIRVNWMGSSTDSAWSNVITVVTPSNVPPAAPTNLVVTRQAGPQFTLTWTDHATNETGFAIERSTDGLPFLPLATAPASSGTGTTSFIDTTVENEHSYRYQVAAVNSVDQSAWATSVVVWTQANAPSDLAGTVGPTGTTVALSWIDHSSVEGSFALQRSTDPTFATVSQFTRPANSTTFTQQGLTLGTTYYYRIRVNWMGSSTDSAWSNVITVVTPSNVPPAAPTNLVVTRQAGPPEGLWMFFRAQATGTSG